MCFWATVCKTVRLMLSDRCLSCLSCPVLSVTWVYCGQTVGRIKMKLGVQVGLGPGHIVLDEHPAPPPPKGRTPNFRPYLLWPNGWMHQDATCYGGMPQPRGLCVRWGPSPPPKFSAQVYYSYCDFVRTLHSRYWFVQVQVQVLVLYAFYF